MTYYRKKPVVIEAVQWEGEDIRQIAPFLTDCVRADVRANDDGTLHVNTLEGVMTAQKGDWIIRGVKGELYPCKPDIFAATYDRSESAS
jgi:hypothetical protein